MAIRQGTQYNDWGLKGTSGDDFIWGRGGDDILWGIGGHDTLDGGPGNDTLYGGAGMNTFRILKNEGHDWIVDSKWGDKVALGYGIAESALQAVLRNNNLELYIGSNQSVTLQGWATTQHRLISVTLANGTKVNLSALRNKGIAYRAGGGNDTIYGGNGNDTFYGGYGKDTLVGGNGDDTLVGGNGDDTLTGGAGRDVFRFDTVLGWYAKGDVITDFRYREDRIQLSQDIFSGLKNGTLKPENFIRVTKDPTGWPGYGNDVIIYNTQTGALFYDRDGKYGAAAVQFATLKDNPYVSAANFFVVRQ